MYSLRDYGNMIADAARFGAYREAIARAVRPGDTLLELGCGPGVFAMLACQAGARKVYAIESEDVLEFARELAAVNGFADRIEFIQSDSRKTALPERVNVIVSDIRGVLPLYDHAVPTVEDARRRFLAPGGILIPARDTLRAAVIEANELYCRLIAPWKVRDMDLSSSLPLVLNSHYSAEVKGEQMLTDSLSWAELDYAAGASAHVTGELTFRASRTGTAHGLCVWFETQLFDDIGYSTGPGAVNSIYGQTFFPWMEAVPIEPGQEIHVALHADLVGKDYVWRWETKVRAGKAGVLKHFRQSTLNGAVLSRQSLRRRATDFVPVLSEAGEGDLFLLQAMNGKTSLEKMAQAAAARFPKLFPQWEDAFQRAIELAEKLAR